MRRSYDFRQSFDAAVLASTAEDSQDAATSSARHPQGPENGEETDSASRSLHHELSRRIRSLSGGDSLEGPFRESEAAAALSAAAAEAAGHAAEAALEPWGMDSLVRQASRLMPAWFTPKVQGLVLLNLLVRPH